MRSRATRGPLLLTALLAPAAWFAQATAAQAPSVPEPVASPSANAAADQSAVAEIEACGACHEPALAGMKGTFHLGLDRACASCHGDVQGHLQSVMETGTPGPIGSFKRMKPREVNAACSSPLDNAF